MNLSSRRKLKPGDAFRFANAEPALFAELAKVVCTTGMLPQKELHECWQMAAAVHRTFPNSLHIADLAAGHGLLAWILVLLARSGETPIPRTAVAVDIHRPKSAEALAAAITDHWPDLRNSVHYVEGSIDSVIAEDGPGTLLVAAHACGSLSDRVLMAAIASHNPVAIMPCCHSLRKQGQTLSSLALASGLSPYKVDSLSSAAATVGQAASIDQFRIDALRVLGYQIMEASIQPEITGYHRIIMGQPPMTSAARTHSLHPRSGAEGLMKRLGEIRAHEKVSTLNVANIEEAAALSRRPSREWIRSFDLSYWVDHMETGQQLAETMELLVHKFLRADPASLVDAPESSVSIQDRYLHPVTQRLAFTYRIQIRSSTIGISKADGILLRKNLCQALASMAPPHEARFTLRGSAQDPDRGSSQVHN